ncbi:MAG: squalene--hopene cyclase [Bdellovibrionota bacterium]
MDNNTETNSGILDPTTHGSRQGDLLELALNATENAKDYLFRTQKGDGHWVAELESNTTITSEYVFMCQMLGIDLSPKREQIIKYLSSKQKQDGSWGIAFNHAGDVSTTAETYLALRILGVDVSDARLKNAERYILANGGLEKIRIFTRINFASFGLFPWEAVPVIPPEFILFPPQSPVNIYTLSSWARGTMVPLFIIFHHRPLFALPNGKSAQNDWLDHLWLDPKSKNIPYSSPWLEILRKNGVGWKSFFSSADVFLKAYEKVQSKTPLSKLRQYAVKKCEQWVLEHQEKSGDWAGIFPPMVNGVIALCLNGHALDSDPVRRGLEAIERFGINDEEGFRVEACQSPVWDSIFALTACVDAGHDGRDSRLLAAREWISSKQILADYGDWKVYNPKGPSGGWSFEYENSWYPDVDDTAAIVIGFLKQDPSSGNTDVVRNAVDWIVSMQNTDGGWAAFDVNNDKLFLNQIPFSDMDSLCDPSSPDVTARVLEALGILDDPKYAEFCRKGLNYLRCTQEDQGSWFGRWGVNYVYGTSGVLAALSRHAISKDDPMVVKGIEWLKKVQNLDGGWGECLESYSDKSLMGKGASTASQTAWGLIGLLAYLPATDSSIQRGVRWLVERQNQTGSSRGSWAEEEFTGTGFPNHFYLRYHMYRHNFPLMALGRFCRSQLS